MCESHVCVYEKFLESLLWGRGGGERAGERWMDNISD